MTNRSKLKRVKRSEYQYLFEKMNWFFTPTTLKKIKFPVWPEFSIQMSQAPFYKSGQSYLQRNNKPKSTKKSEHDYIHNRTSKLLGILKIVKSTCVLSLLMNVNLMIMHREFYLQPKCTLCNAYTLSEHFWVSRLSVKLQLIWIALWPFVILNVKMIKDQLKFNGCKCFPELTVINQLN